MNLPKDIIVHYVYQKDGQWVICYERRSEWKPRNAFLIDFLSHLESCTLDNRAQLEDDMQTAFSEFINRKWRKS